MGRVRITRPFVLLALVALLAPRVEASRTSAWESNPPASAVLAKADVTSALAPLAPAADGDSELADGPRFDLGDVVLVESELESEDRFGLGPLDAPRPSSATRSAAELSGNSRQGFRAPPALPRRGIGDAKPLGASGLRLLLPGSRVG